MPWQVRYDLLRPATNRHSLMLSANDKQDDEMQILACDLWVMFTYAGGDERLSGFLERSTPAFKHLAESMILYESVTVPTQDFLTLSALISRLGERPVIDLLESGTLRFLRLNGGLAYA